MAKKTRGTQKGIGPAIKAARNTSRLPNRGLKSQLKAALKKL
jgi:hypothetical protein